MSRTEKMIRAWCEALKDGYKSGEGIEIGVHGCFDLMSILMSILTIYYPKREKEKDE